MSQSTAQGMGVAVPVPIRRIQLDHMSELPHNYGTTPGGTLFSTTPGGTRIIYERSFLLKCRNSPLSNTPPSNLPDIPGVTSPDKSPSKLITRIEEEKEIPKENGGHYWQQSLRSPPSLPQAAGFDAFPVAQGPLQQYRQRNFLLQQNNAMVESAFTPPSPICPGLLSPNAMHQQQSPMMHYPPALPPPFDPNNNRCSGDGLWQLGQTFAALQSSKGGHPTSQLNAWRQAKFNQVLSQAVTQTLVDTPQLLTSSLRSANVNSNNASSSNAHHQGHGSYRGRGRGVQISAPFNHVNLCKPMQKLFLSRDQGPGHFNHHQYSNSANQAVGMPMYGQLKVDKPDLKEVDENSNLVQ